MIGCSEEPCAEQNRQDTTVPWAGNFVAAKNGNFSRWLVTPHNSWNQRVLGSTRELQWELCCQATSSTLSSVALAQLRGSSLELNHFHFLQPTKQSPTASKPNPGTHTESNRYSLGIKTSSQPHTAGTGRRKSSVLATTTTWISIQ